MATNLLETDNSGNPSLGSEAARSAFAARADRTMTIGGTTLKTLTLLVVLAAGAAWGWASATTPVATDVGQGFGNTTVTIPGGFWLASFGALFVGIFLAVNPRRGAVLGVIYAVLQGYCLGAISAAFDAQTEGIVSAAILSTLFVFLVALFLYATRIVRPTQKLAFAVIAGMGGLCLMYLFVGIAAIFDFGWLYSDQFRTIGLVVTILAVVLAGLALVLDFGFIEAASDAGAPKYMEWYAAHALMVTIVWLYVTMLRLLALLTRQS